MPGPHGMGGGPHMNADSMKPKNFGGTVKRLLGYLKPNRFLLIFVLILAVLSTLFTILAPSILGLVTTELFDGTQRIIAGTGTIDLGYVGQILLGLLGIYILAQVFNFLNNFYMSRLSQRTMYTLRKQVDEKINRLPFQYFDSNTHGEILSKITNDVDTMSTAFQQVITQLITSVCTVVGIFIMMLTINPWLALLAVLVLPLSLVISQLVVKKSQKYFIGNQMTIGKMNGYVEEMFTGHIITKVFNREKKTVSEFTAINEELYGYGMKSQFLSSVMQPLIGFVGNVGYVLVVCVSAGMAIAGTISVGNIQAMMQYVKQFTQPLGQVAQIMSILQSTVAAAERVFGVLDETEEVPDAVPAEKVSDVHGNVDISHVSFGYTPDRTLIKDLNVTVKSGQKVAIVGPTGAGKTTIINLLMRFYDVGKGSIKVDGVDIRNMKRDDLRDIFGMVLQETWLFNGTIRENIAYGSMEPPTEDEIHQAAKSACADHFIKTLPDGYDLVLNEEANNVSGGQKQLLTIARAFISDPAILILDEATSSVDTRTEVLIQKAMSRLMKGRTSFVIAHRLSTIKDADLILVLKDGDIVEQGTHEGLMEKNGFYTELYNSQFAAKQIA